MGSFLLGALVGFFLGYVLSHRGGGGKGGNQPDAPGMNPHSL